MFRTFGKLYSCFIWLKFDDAIWLYSWFVISLIIGCSVCGINWIPEDKNCSFNISSAYKTDTSLTTLSVLIGAFDEPGSCDGDAPHGMEECRGAYDESGGGGR